MVDIDGTLTHDPMQRWGTPRTNMIKKIKKLIAGGHEIILWSAGGKQYAKDFSKRYKINAIACIPKPDIMIDDKPTLRSCGIPILSPDIFLEI